MLLASEDIKQKQNERAESYASAVSLLEIKAINKNNIDMHLIINTRTRLVKDCTVPQEQSPFRAKLGHPIHSQLSHRLLNLISSS